jgi:hypothetical protein
MLIEFEIRAFNINFYGAPIPNSIAGVNFRMLAHIVCPGPGNVETLYIFILPDEDAAIEPMYSDGKIALFLRKDMLTPLIEAFKLCPYRSVSTNSVHPDTTVIILGPAGSTGVSAPVPEPAVNLQPTPNLQPAPMIIHITSAPAVTPQPIRGAVSPDSIVSPDS